MGQGHGAVVVVLGIDRRDAGGTDDVGLGMSGLLIGERVRRRAGIGNGHPVGGEAVDFECRGRARDQQCRQQADARISWIRITSFASLSFLDSSSE
jgi:hypothetical protein